MAITGQWGLKDVDDITYQADNDLYELFELAPTASADEIAKAHKRLAKTCHPDLHPDKPWATEQFKEINRAYAILKDPVSKGDYDRLRWRAIGHGATQERPRRKGPIKQPVHSQDLDRERHHKDRLMSYFIFGIGAVVMTFFLVLVAYRAITKEKFQAQEVAPPASAFTAR